VIRLRSTFVQSALFIHAVDLGSKSLLWLQVTTARKAVTLLLSYVIFTKPLSGQHCTGLLLIAMGIALKSMPDNCQQRIMASHAYIPIKSEASTSGLDPADVASKLEEGEIKRHLSH